jgi:putative SOS response-associated peptidase YedK
MSKVPSRCSGLLPPFAIAMKDGRPFGIGGLWENSKDPTSSEWIRTFAIITTDANELVAEIERITSWRT